MYSAFCVQYLVSKQTRNSLLLRFSIKRLYDRRRTCIVASLNFIHPSRISPFPNVFPLCCLHIAFTLHKAHEVLLRQFYFLADTEIACNINAVKAQYVGDTKKVSPFTIRKGRTMWLIMLYFRQCLAPTTVKCLRYLDKSSKMNLKYEGKISTFDTLATK